MKKLKSNISLLQKATLSTLLSMGLFFFTTLSALAQAGQTDEVAMADALRAEGKIYVVVGVILLIFVGMIIYMLRIERKVSRLEKELEN